MDPIFCGVCCAWPRLFSRSWGPFLLASLRAAICAEHAFLPKWILTLGPSAIGSGPKESKAAAFKNIRKDL
jgi:hypothetical protein